jgi:hypothetical protein
LHAIETTIKTKQVPISPSPAQNPVQNSFLELYSPPTSNEHLHLQPIVKKDYEYGVNKIYPKHNVYKDYGFLDLDIDDLYKKYKENDK